MCCVWCLRWHAAVRSHFNRALGITGFSEKMNKSKEAEVTKSIYSISVINEGRESDYRDFWNNGLKTNSDGEELHSDLVGFTEIVEARNLSEAISSVKKKYPDNSIAEEHSSKIS